MNYKPKQYDYYLGIDPDFEASGFSMLDKQNRCITESHALPFPDAINYLDALAAGDMKDKTLVIIEDSFSTTNWHIDKLMYAPIDTKQKLRKAAAMGHGIGLCHSTQAHLQQYAESVGINTHAVWMGLLVVTSLLTATVTAFCGPIAFIGLAVPHIARMVLRTDSQSRLLRMSILTGGAVALLCNWICCLPASGGVIPLNAVTPLIGAPVIIYVIIHHR